MIKSQRCQDVSCMPMGQKLTSKQQISGVNSSFNALENAIARPDDIENNCSGETSPKINKEFVRFSARQVIICMFSLQMSTLLQHISSVCSNFEVVEDAITRSDDVEKTCFGQASSKVDETLVNSFAR